MAVKFKIKKGDQVIVITGRDKGKRGKVLRVLRDTRRVLVAGINVATLCSRGDEFAGFVENQAAWPIGQIDAGLFEQRRRGFEPGVSNRQDMVAHGSVKGPGHGLGAFDRSEERAACGS